MSSTPHTTEGRLGEVRFLTVAEVATLMRVSKMTVYRLVHAGDLTAVTTDTDGSADVFAYTIKTGIVEGISRP